MMRYLCTLILPVLPLLCSAAENPTALDALQMLPKEELKRLVRIEAFDGTPLPERWHFLVHDPNTRTGVREYVVADGALVASRSISQFADTLRETDVIGSAAVQVDSDGLAELARDFATANKIPITSVSYHLYKGSAGNTEPVWRVNCLDAEGKGVGELVVTATAGNVISHAGFATRPEKSAKALAVARSDNEDEADEKKRSQASAPSSRANSAATSSSRKKTASSSSGRSERNRSRPTADRSSPRRELRQYPRGEPVVIRSRPRNPISSLFRKIFR